MRTFEKCVEIARRMRECQSTMLDITGLSTVEVANIVELVRNDALFQFFDEFKDMDIACLYAAVKHIEAMEAYKAVRICKKVME